MPNIDPFLVFLLAFNSDSTCVFYYSAETNIATENFVFSEWNSEMFMIVAQW